MLKIFLDLDEVMADFRAGAMAVHGLDRAGMDARFGAGYWTGEAFWEPIAAAGEAFWCDLSPFPWALELIHFAESLTKDWYILTSPSQCPGSLSGKHRWVAKHLGVRPWERLIPFGAKELLAAPGRYLVDDHQPNLDKWEAAGGVGVLFPHWGNRLAVYAGDPVGYVRTVIGNPPGLFRPR